LKGYGDMAEKPFLPLAHGKFSYLLISLIVLLLLFPIVSEVFIERVIFDIFLSIVLLSAVYAVSPKRHIFTVFPHLLEYGRHIF